MSNAGPSQAREFDFWDYVSCIRCHLPYVSDNSGQPQIPFWITECGHVVCNGHLNSDQSCIGCGAKGIQVAPLQREMDPPMSDWFRSAPQAVDTLAFSVRFQIETLASLVHYYRKRCSQQRALIERAKAESLEKKQLKKQVEQLQLELTQLRTYVGQEPSESSNHNGKRRMLDAHRHMNGTKSNSSPRSISTPIGPDRLTLPPSHQQPAYYSSRSDHSDDGSRQPYRTSQQNRPGSSRFAEQYAFDPAQSQPSSNRFEPQRPESRQDPRHARIQLPTGIARTVPVPPILDQREDSAETSNSRIPFPADYQRVSGPGSTSKSHMPPPPVPIHQQSAVSRHDQRTSFRPQPVPSRHDTQSQPGPPLSTPRSNQSQSQNFQNNRAFTPALQTQRFIPPSSSRQTFNEGGSRAPSRMAGGGQSQRMPFVPGNGEGSLPR
ncbi:hypothetical protein C8Q75DRAFT_740350 [Abortiporus biennis]|nr:hypothetical protein C8Q75DRAFT_740350 [Abortiporus biennis]